MNTMRPSEKAAEDIIKRKKNFDENIKSGIRTVSNIGTSAAGVGLGAKILPFLSEHIPVELAIKGISKISPQIGNFLKRGMDKGLDVKEGLSFVKSKFEQNNQKESKISPKENRNIIEQYSPELHEFIKGELAKGRPHLEAGALAQVNDKFKKIIKKIEQDHKTPFSAILDTTYGGGSYGGSVNPPQQQAQSTQQQPQQQPGSGQQALMAILQKIQQSRGG